MENPPTPHATIAERSATIRNLGVLLFDQIELLDFCGPYEVFSIANRKTDSPAFNVFTVAQSLDPVCSHNNLRVLPHHTFDGHPPIDILLAPGGGGTRREIHNQPLIEWIRRTAAGAELLLSVCTGALLLGKAGLLDHLQATTHAVAIDLLRELAPTATVLENRRWVDNGKVITSAGIASGIDMSLHVVSRLLGENIARATAAHLEYTG